MSSLTTVGLGRLQKCFAVKETTLGQIAIPVAGNMIVINSGNINVPDPILVEDKGLRGSRSMFGQYNAGTPGAPFKLAHYMKPSGAAGTAPEADCILESAFGKKTTTGGVSVVYDPNDTQPSFSLYVKKDHTVYVGAGCSVDKFGTKKDNKNLLEASVDGKALSVIWTGTGALAEAITTAPAAGTEEWWTVDDVKKWCTGSHILIDTEQMQITGTYWEGTAGSSAGKIKMKRGHNASTPATHINTAAITPWLPNGTETGMPLAARVGTLTLDALTIPFLDIDFSLENGIVLNEDEVTGADNPTDYFEGDRKVGGSLNLYFRKGDAKYFADAKTQTRKAAVLNFGSIAGKKIQITMNYCQFNMPQLPEGEGVMKIGMKYMGYASAGNDEASLKFY